MSSIRTFVACLALTVTAAAQTTYSNGPMITHPGAAVGGADASILEAGTTTFGVAGGPVNFRLADDFTVPCGESWLINTFRFFSYQTGSVAPNTAGNYRIWNGQPGTAGAMIVHDFSATSQFVSGAPTNIYRVTAAAPLDNTRRIYSTDLNGNSIVLDPGTYWLDFQIAGNSGLGGPFVPMISGTGIIAPAGNSIQGQLAAGGSTFWNNGTLTGNVPSAVVVGLPFEIDYVMVPGPACYEYTITQSGPGASLVISNAGGTPFTLYLNAITLNQGTFPFGWYNGVDIPFTELLNEIILGAPLFGVLDAMGAQSFTVPAGVLPPGTVLYTASNNYGPSTLLASVQGFTYTVL